MEKLKKNALPVLCCLALLCIASWLESENFKSRFLAQERITWKTKLLDEMRSFEWGWYDFKFSRGQTRLAHKVAVAKIDDASLDAYGRWPWNRKIYSELLDQIYAKGAKVVAFDAVFSEPEYQRSYLRFMLDNPIHGREGSLAEELNLKKEQGDRLVEILPEIGDLHFSAGVARHPSTVLGYLWQPASSCRVYNPLTSKEFNRELTPQEAARFGYRHVETLVDSLASMEGQELSVQGVPPITEETPSRLPRMLCPITNRSNIAASARFQGFFNFIPDSDGIFRRAPSFFGYSVSGVPEDERDFLPEGLFAQASFFPSLALQALRSYWEAEYSLELSEDDQGRLAMRGFNIHMKDGNKHFIETNLDGSLLVDFLGSQKAKVPPVLEFSLANVDDDLKNPDTLTNYGLPMDQPLKDHIVFIGPTSLGVYDIRPSPVQKDLPGVFLHANMTSQLLRHIEQRTSYAVNQAGLGVQLSLLWGLGILFSSMVLFGSAVSATALVLLAASIVLAVDFFLFQQLHMSFDIVLALGVALLCALTLFLYKYFTEEKDRAFVKGAFEKYVNPNVVDSIMKDPKKLNLGGQKKRLSVLFSDIRGFTTISEKMGASQLANFLNEYLTPMSDIVMEHDGTVDKYMGDAIMAIFGAPIDDPKHASKAVDTALHMLSRLKELQAEWKAANLPEIDIGVGINTGEMSVGNMGSKKIFSYTVMGDSVNLGSRLESINKEYRTRLIVSEFTKEDLPQEYLCRLLDRVKVKGKKEPVSIYEVQCKDPQPAQRESVKRFEEAMQKYFTQDFDEARAIFSSLCPQDPTAELFVERCDLFKANPPEKGWDGTWTMTTK